MPRLVLVAGAQDLARCPRAMAWYDRLLQVEVQALAREPGSLVVTAGAPGPEVCAEMLAATFGVTSVAYLSSGARRVDGHERGRWTPAVLASGGAAVVRRDRALIDQARERAAQGHRVEVLALLIRGASPRSSSLTRALAAEEAGLPVRWLTWGSAPALQEAAE